MQVPEAVIQVPKGEMQVSKGKGRFQKGKYKYHKGKCRSSQKIMYVPGRDDTGPGRDILLQALETLLENMRV